LGEAGDIKLSSLDLQPFPELIDLELKVPGREIDDGGFGPQDATRPHALIVDGISAFPREKEAQVAPGLNVEHQVEVLLFKEEPFEKLLVIDESQIKS
jgi:hypothetical protein